MKGTRPLRPKAETLADADTFRRQCFAEHGKICYFKGRQANPPRKGPGEQCLKDATDPMHIVGRAHLGPKARYALGAVNGRPGCRNCHDLQEANRLQFDLKDRRKAVVELNKLFKVKMEVP